MKGRDWENLSREELLEEQARTSNDLQAVNIELATARRNAAGNGKFLKVEDLRALEEKRASILAGQRKLAALLAKRKAESKLHFSEFFYRAAEDLIVDDDLFDTIYDEAQKRFTAAKEEANAR